jgi:hypothetical protein
MSKGVKKSNSCQIKNPKCKRPRRKSEVGKFRHFDPTVFFHSCTKMFTLRSFDHINIPYQSYDKNPRIILERVACHRMIGVLKHVGQMSEYAAEIFEQIFALGEESNKRIKMIDSRIADLEAKQPKLNKIFSSNPPTNFYRGGIVSEFSRQDDLIGNLIAAKSRPRIVNVLFSKAQAPPNFSPMDEISGQECFRKYSNPKLFMEVWMKQMQDDMDKIKAQNAEDKKKNKKKKKKKAKKQIVTLEKRKWATDTEKGEALLIGSSGSAVQTVRQNADDSDDEEQVKSPRPPPPAEEEILVEKSTMTPEEFAEFERAEAEFQEQQRKYEQDMIEYERQQLEYKEQMEAVEVETIEISIASILIHCFTRIACV